VRLVTREAFSFFGHALWHSQSWLCSFFFHQPNLKIKNLIKEKSMPSLTAKDRVSLCRFTYEDGRRCRTPRISSHPHFCFYHAQKESQSQSAEKLAQDLSYFFSGDYVSANDLNTALGRLIPAVIRGEIKPRVARTVAYMLQTLLQSTRLAQHEYINAFGTDAWRETVSSSVNSNHDHLYPPDPNDPDPNEDEPDDESGDESNDDPELEPDAVDLATEPSAPLQPAAAPPQPPPTTRPSPADTEAALQVARSIFPDRTNSAQSQPTTPTTNPTPTETTQPNNAIAALSEAHCISRRPPHNASTNPFGTNIYTRPGNF
jgi:hypothetical protein